MLLKLTPPEIQRALQVYLGAKLGVSPNTLEVRLRWRGQYAEVEQIKVPVLNDAVGDE